MWDIKKKGGIREKIYVEKKEENFFAEPPIYHVKLSIKKKVKLIV